MSHIRIYFISNRLWGVRTPFNYFEGNYVTWYTKSLCCSWQIFEILASAEIATPHGYFWHAIGCYAPAEIATGIIGKGGVAISARPPLFLGFPPNPLGPLREFISGGRAKEKSQREEPNQPIFFSLFSSLLA